MGNNIGNEITISYVESCWNFSNLKSILELIKNIDSYDRDLQEFLDSVPTHKNFGWYINFGPDNHIIYDINKFELCPINNLFTKNARTIRDLLSIIDNKNKASIVLSVHDENKYIALNKKFSCLYN